ncbi:hypothetical protein A8F95_03055 [Bacillus wudalianchiensis]|uniref:Uncharacterized protein n=1 Tax=Pseudobacillus wudalianchiensis TaxID=1743143 RepID=A0A1B9B9B0_9BACI|nr:hypothetical protein A8F95_03055 [Bacillus wudalianchiensis]
MVPPLFAEIKILHTLIPITPGLRLGFPKGSKGRFNKKAGDGAFQPAGSILWHHFLFTDPFSSLVYYENFLLSVYSLSYM